MNSSKPLPIAAAIAGVLAVIGITIKLAGTSTNSFEARVDESLDQEKQLTTSDPFENLTSRIEELSNLRDDTGYSKLPPVKKEKVNDYLSKLRDLARYQTFEKQLNEIPDPKAAGSGDQLKDIENRLRKVEIPDKIPDAIKVGTAIQRRQEWLTDADALQVIFRQLERDYNHLINEAKLVILTKNEPQLPERLKKVFDLAKNLKTPENKDQFVPGSERVTYAMVFRLAEIDNLVRDWNKLKDQLEPAANFKK
jgi:hypothetical protein